MERERFEDVAETCWMLSDVTRASIVAVLARGGEFVGPLCRKLNLPKYTTSHHLNLLRLAGLVRRKQKGRQAYYSLNRAKLTAVKKFVAKLK